MHAKFRTTHDSIVFCRFYFLSFSICDAYDVLFSLHYFFVKMVKYQHLRPTNYSDTRCTSSQILRITFCLLFCDFEIQIYSFSRSNCPSIYSICKSKYKSIDSFGDCYANTFALIHLQAITI